MLLDPALLDLINNYNISPKDVIENYGIWFSPKEMQKEFNYKSLEDMFYDYYWILDKNEFKFCSAEEIEKEIEFMINKEIYKHW